MSSQQEEKKNTVEIDAKVLNSDFLQGKADFPLRVTCYGSSSSKTPEKYLKEAKALGYALAIRGHTCVNGAGQFGCMAAMNDGAAEGNGHIVGVIHEMFIETGEGGGGNTEAVGAHGVFNNTNNNYNKDGSSGPLREILIASGDNLQERKRFLVDGSDALIVLPGGPGTWDELWEMACARNIGLTDLPIVCVNVDKYYEPFNEMLKKSNEDELIYIPPEDILHFEPTAEAAVRWVEAKVQKVKDEESKQGDNKVPSSTKKRRGTLLKRSSFLDPSPSIFNRFRSTVSRTFSSFYAPSDMSVGGSSSISEDGLDPIVYCYTNNHIVLTFAAGLAIGVTVATQMNRTIRN